MMAHAAPRSTHLLPLSRTMLALAALAVGGSTAAAEPSHPIIERFYATPTPLVRGETAQVAWKVSGAVRIEVDGFEKDCDCERGLEDSDYAAPQTSTTFTLRAYGAGGEVVTRSIVLEVVERGPAIQYFYAKPNPVAPGEPTEILWSVNNAARIEIDGFLKDCDCERPLEGSDFAAVEATTVFTLRAYDDAGAVSTATLVVGTTEGFPVIDSFTASATAITRGQLVMLGWKTRNAVECEVRASRGPVLRHRAPEGVVFVTPNKTTTYTLTAIGDGREVEQGVTVVVTGK